MTSVVLGPYACQMLGDLGADIVKIEPLAGDTNRNLGPHANDPKMSALFLTCNRNKRSVALDLKSDAGREAALKLIETADVVVHNFRPQAMERLGLDYEQVKAVNPSVVYCATYGYSKKGPYGDKGALDDSIQAASGIAILRRRGRRCHRARVSRGSSFVLFCVSKNRCFSFLPLGYWHALLLTNRTRARRNHQSIARVYLFSLSLLIVIRSCKRSPGTNL